MSTVPRVLPFLIAKLSPWPSSFITSLCYIYKLHFGPLDIGLTDIMQDEVDCVTEIVTILEI